jgi:predicted ATPase
MRIFHGWAVAVSGEPARGVAEICDGIVAWRAIRMRLATPMFATLLAEAHRVTGDVDEALRALEDVDPLVDRTGHRAFEPARLHLRGELLCADSCDRAEPALLHALQTAREQGCRAIELRAATSLARLWAEAGERHKAHDLLASVYEWFTEGFDTRDLKEAKALLDQLT